MEFHKNALGVKHKVHTYTEYHSVCPLVGIGTLPPLLSQASVPLPPEPEGGGWAHSPAGEGLGVPILTTGEKLSTLPTLWGEVFHQVLKNVHRRLWLTSVPCTA
jgi:hypothetical protein